MDTFLSAWGALIDGGAFEQDALRIGFAVLISTAFALCLRQQSMQLVKLLDVIHINTESTLG
jgi:hypothetical protein